MGLVFHTGTSWHFPNCAVENPFSFSVSASGAAVLGRIELYPGADVAISVIPPIPTEWWLRPVSSAWRVGEHSAVVWKRLYFSPFAASRSAVGVAQGPPTALAAPNPTSSSNTTSTFGAPAGGRSGSIAGNDVSGSLASYGSVPSNGVSGTGSTSRRGPSDSAWLTKILSTGCPSRHPPHRIARGHHPIGVSERAQPAADASQSLGPMHHLALPLRDTQHRTNRPRAASSPASAR